MENRDENMKHVFCQNSRRWLVFMDLIGVYPSTCPHEGDCDNCGYLKEREPTKYLLRKKKLVGFIDEKVGVVE